MKVPFTFGIDCPCEFFLGCTSETHMGEKSLIVPCTADKRKLITIYADAERRNGDFYEKTELL